MKSTLSIIGVNSALEHLRNKTFAGEIISFGPDSPYKDAQMFLIKDGEKQYIFELKNTTILDSIVLAGILQDGETFGKAAIQIKL